MKKLDRTHRTYFLIVAALILFILCITGIAYHGDTGDAQIVEHEEIPVIPEEGSVSGNSELIEKTDGNGRTKDIEKTEEPDKTEETEESEEPEPSFESDIRENQGISQEISDTEEDSEWFEEKKYLDFEWFEAERYLEQEIPEFDIYDSFINKKTEGKAYLVVESGIKPDELYGNNQEFLGNYYMIYVGEKWEDHRANWYWFYVREDFEEILWYEITECEYYSLEEWRDSSWYKEQMERIMEYLEENG